MQFQSDTTNDGKLAYDLRQIYAKLVGEHLIDVAVARKKKDYPAYFEALEDLYITTKHNYKADKKKKKPKKEGKKPKEIKTYESLKKDFLIIATKYPDAYLGKTQDPEELNHLKIALNNIEIHLWHKIKEAKMIGVKDSEEGLL